MSVLALQGKTNDELIALILSLKQGAQRKLTLKVSAKGAVSLYGMGRFPVTLYAQQWDKVLDEAQTIRDFIAAHQDVLSSGKDDSRFAQAAE